jgi:hypothetical protein
MYHQIIKEDQEEFPQLLVEDMIPTILEGGWCISYPKGHNYKFVVTIMTSESCFGNIFLPHFDMIKAKA